MDFLDWTLRLYGPYGLLDFKDLHDGLYKLYDFVDLRLYGLL